MTPIPTFEHLKEGGGREAIPGLRQWCITSPELIQWWSFGGRVDSRVLCVHREREKGKDMPGLANGSVPPPLVN